MHPNIKKLLEKWDEVTDTSSPFYCLGIVVAQTIDSKGTVYYKIMDGNYPSKLVKTDKEVIKELWSRVYKDRIEGLIERLPYIEYLKITEDLFTIVSGFVDRTVHWTHCDLIERTDWIVSNLKDKANEEYKKQINDWADETKKLSNEIHKKLKIELGMENRRENIDNIKKLEEIKKLDELEELKWSKQLKEFEELEEFYGEEDLCDTGFVCSGCMFDDFDSSERCDFEELEDDEGYYICEACCDKNITNKTLILTKERTERSICRVLKLSNGDRVMELLEVK